MADSNRANTINPQFNSSWNHLVQVHTAVEAGSTVNIELKVQPKFSTKNGWLDWLDSFLNVVKIGSRNGWVALHLDGSGRPQWLSVERKILEGGK